MELYDKETSSKITEEGSRILQDLQEKLFLSNKIRFFTDFEKIEQNAMQQIENLEDNDKVDSIAVFPDIHYCSEKGVPVGLAFSSTTHVFPLITGKDMGCGVAFLRIPKKFILEKTFDKSHYPHLNRDSQGFTDEGLGGGNHFLSIEEDAEAWYIICHTGTRNLGISMYQKNYRMIEEHSEDGVSLPIEKLEELDPNWWINYEKVLEYGRKRRKEFIYKTLLVLVSNGYVNNMTLAPNCKVSNFHALKKDLKMLEEVFNSHELTYGDSIHNHITIEKRSIFTIDTETSGEISMKETFETVYVHRKGSTELKPGETVVIPLSMTRGSLLVKTSEWADSNWNTLNSCSHGAGRKLSRTDTLKYWHASMKKKQRQEYKEKFSELLDSSGEFPRGYIQEFDFAYKDSSTILKDQPHLQFVTYTTPIVTFKFTEI